MREFEYQHPATANHAQLMLLLLIITIELMHHLMQALKLMFGVSLGSMGSHGDPLLQLQQLVAEDTMFLHALLAPVREVL